MLRCASKEKVSHFKLQPLIPHSCCTYREIEQNQKGGAFGAGGGATPGATGGGWEKRRRRGGQDIVLRSRLQLSCFLYHCVHTFVQNM